MRASTQTPLWVETAQALGQGERRLALLVGMPCASGSTPGYSVLGSGAAETCQSYKARQARGPPRGAKSPSAGASEGQVRRGAPRWPGRGSGRGGRQGGRASLPGAGRGRLGCGQASGVRLGWLRRRPGAEEGAWEAGPVARPGDRLVLASLACAPQRNPSQPGKLRLFLRRG